MKRIYTWIPALVATASIGAGVLACTAESREISSGDDDDAAAPPVPTATADAAVEAAPRR